MWFFALCPDGGEVVLLLYVRMAAIWSCWFLTDWPRIGPVAVCSNGHVASCGGGKKFVSLVSGRRRIGPVALCLDGGELFLLRCVRMAAN